jgi:hypothetical protein
MASGELQIVQFPNASNITSGDNLLFQQGPVNTPYTYATVEQLFQSSPSAYLLQTTLIGGSGGASWTVSGLSAASTMGLYEHITAVSGIMVDTSYSPLNEIICGHDNRAVTGAIKNLVYLDNQPGVGSQGVTHTLDVDLFSSLQTSDFSAGNSSPIFTASRFSAWGEVNQGGTTLTTTGSYGDLFALNSEAFLTNPATYWHGITSFEADVAVYASASVYNKCGIRITCLPLDATQGTIADTALVISNQSGTSPGWNQTIQVGLPISQWPVFSGGNIIGASRGINDTSKPALAAWGVDFLQPSFSSGFLRSINFIVDSSGAAHIGAGSISPHLSGLAIAANGQIGSLSGISSAGTSYTTGTIIRDDWGGKYQVSTVNASGNVLSLITLTSSYTSGASIPANPISTYMVSGNSGNGLLKLNLNWANTGNVLIQSPLILSTPLSPLYGGTGASATPSGTVTSVGLSLPSGIFSISGSPITSSGTIIGTFATQSSANLFLASPANSSGVLNFRKVSASDLPSPFANLSPFAGSLIASGSTSGTAFQISSLFNIFTLVVSTSGCILPIKDNLGNSLSGGVVISILNRGANILSVWPGSGATIENLTVNASGGVAPSGAAKYVWDGGSNWYVF